jgi:hypothetical protein
MIAETAGVVLSWVEKKAAHLPDCIKTIGNITTVNATTFFANHSIPHARA